MKQSVVGLLIGFAFSGLCLCTYWALAHVGMTHQITVDGKTHELIATSVVRPKYEGIHIPIIITNAQVRVLKGPGGETGSAVRSDGAYLGMQERDLYSRLSTNMFGERVFSYSVHVQCSFYGDRDVIVSCTVPGGGHHGYRVEGTIIGPVTRDHFAMKVTEYVHGFATEYMVDVTMSEKAIQCQIRDI